ncbi:MAG: hypothetical protein V1720_17500 [bacterium]
MSEDFPDGMSQRAWIALGYLDNPDNRSDAIWNRLEQECEDEGWSKESEAEDE